jgi:uncharacterized protein YfaT (DUF1175 family)
MTGAKNLLIWMGLWIAGVAGPAARTGRELINCAYGYGMEKIRWNCARQLKKGTKFQ